MALASIFKSIIESTGIVAGECIIYNESNLQVYLFPSVMPGDDIVVINEAFIEPGIKALAVCLGNDKQLAIYISRIAEAEVITKIESGELQIAGHNSTKVL